MMPSHYFARSVGVMWSSLSHDSQLVYMSKEKDLWELYHRKCDELGVPQEKRERYAGRPDAIRVQQQDLSRGRGQGRGRGRGRCGGRGGRRESGSEGECALVTGSAAKLNDAKITEGDADALWPVQEVVPPHCGQCSITGIDLFTDDCDGNRYCQGCWVQFYGAPPPFKTSDRLDTAMGGFKRPIPADILFLDEEEQHLNKRCVYVGVRAGSEKTRHY